MYWFLLIFTFILSSCVSPLEKGEVTLDIKNTKSQQKPSPLVSNITLENDQLKISGSNFLSLSSVKIDSQNLSVISNDGSNLVLSAPSAVMLALNSILNLVIETSYGATSVAVTFNLVDGSVTASKIGDGEIGANHLSSMGAGVGQVMQWNGTTWVPTDLSGLVYMGSWDATLSGVGPDAGSGTSAGEYYVVSNAGTVDVDGTSSWAAGDWVVWNGTNWDKIDNSTGVTSFNGRAGTITPLANDYTWAQINKTTSSVGDIADVDMTGVASGKILKWDGSKWAISDDLSSGGAGSVSSSEIQDGTIAAGDLDASLNTTLSQVGTNTTDITSNTSSISTNATNITTNTSSISTNSSNIATNASGISTNATDISNRLPLAGGTMSGDIVFSGTQTFDGVDVSALETTVNTKFDSSDLDTDGTLTANSDTKIPSQKAVKTYVDAKVLTAGTGDFKSDGSVAMTSDLDLGNNKLKFKSDNANYVEVKAPNSLAATYSLVLPADDGTTGQVLSTDGSGALSWINAATGSITAVTVNAPLSATGTSTRDLSISQATTTTDGYLSSTDWNTFNAKVSATRTVNGKALSSDVTLVTTDVAEGVNLYHTDARAKAAAVVNSTAGSETDQAPSVAAIKSYTDTANALKVDKTTTVNGNALSSNIVLDSDDIAEGTTNKYTPWDISGSNISYSSGDIILNDLTVASGNYVTANGDFYLYTENNAAEKLHFGTYYETDFVISRNRIQVLGSTAGSNAYVSAKQGGGTNYAGQNLVVEGGTSTGSGVGGAIIFQTSGLGSAGTSQNAATEKMRISSAGNVGIGISSPSSLLHLSEPDDSWNSSIRMDRSWDSATDYFQMMYDYQGLKIRTMADGTDEAHIIFKPKDSEAMRITEGGKVGIGATVPTEKLTVAGKINVTAGNDFCIDGGTCLTTVAAGSGETNTASSAGGASLVLAKSGVNLPFKGLTATSDIALTQNANDIQIGVGATNGASQLLRLDASGKIPAVDGSLITNIPNDTLSTLLTGLIPGSDTVLSATDSVLGAFENLQAQISATRTIASTNDTDLDSKVDKTTTVNGKALSSNVTLITTDVAEGTNLYYTTARAKADAILNSTAGSETDQGASVAAMKSYVTTSIAGNGVWAKSGSDISYSSGNVGIGTSSPSQKLEVEGIISSGSRDNNSSGGGYHINHHGNNAWFSGIYGFKSRAGTSVLNDDQVFQLIGNGYDGTSYNNVASIIYRVDGTPSAGVVPGEMSFYTTNTSGALTNRMTIDSVGNVGIGTTSPTEKLHVAGSIKVTGNVSLSGEIYNNKHYKEVVSFADGWAIGDFIEVVQSSPTAAGAASGWLVNISGTRGNWTESHTYEFATSHSDASGWQEVLHRSESGYIGASKCFTLDVFGNGNTPKFRVRAIKASASCGVTSSLGLVVDITSRAENSSWTDLSATGNDLTVSQIKSHGLSFNVVTGRPDDISGNLAIHANSSGKVGIRTGSPIYDLDVDGVIHTPIATNSATDISDGLRLHDSYIFHGFESTPVSGLTFSHRSYNDYGFRFGKVPAAENPKGDGSNFTPQMVITNSGNVGIGSPTPAVKLQVSGGSGVSDFPTSTTQGNSIFKLINSNNAIEMGSSGVLNERRSWILARHTSADATYGQYMSTLHLQPDIGAPTNYRGVGIGLDPSVQMSVNGERLIVNGTAAKPGGGSWATYSDARLKNITGNFNHGLEEIVKIKTIKYRYKDDNELGILNEREHSGFIAQDIQKLIPEAVRKTANDFLTVDNDPIFLALINATKELDQNLKMYKLMSDGLSEKIEANSREIASLKDENTALKIKVESLEERIERLEKLLSK